tara:strand:+ start:293 stop:904 length:612 start_codon:yes stop_codon:yes gene_type:complete
MPPPISEEPPDKYIEEVWMGIKNAVVNTFNQQQIEQPVDLNLVSEKLNLLQKEKDYHMIEKTILITISDICRNFIIHRIGAYNCHILDVQIKRWNKVTNKYRFFDKHDIRYVLENCILFYIYYKVIDNPGKYDSLLNMFNSNKLIPTIEDIIDVSVSHNYPIILDKCNNYICVSTYINRSRGTNFFKNTNGRKIIGKLNDKSL